MTYATRFALAAAFAAFSFPAFASSEADFLKRFHGSFAGGGQVRMDDGGEQHAILCKMTGSSTANSVNISGTCSAGIVSKRISASLRAVAGGRYTGTYQGVNGSASLSGRRQGNSIVLAVNGPQKATMTISNSGSRIGLSVVSNKQQMTSVSLSRGGGSQLASFAN